MTLNTTTELRPLIKEPLTAPSCRKKKMAAIYSGCEFTVCALEWVSCGAHIPNMGHHVYTSHPFLLYSIQLYLNEQKCELFTQASGVQ